MAKKAPTIPVYLEPYIAAFLTLSADRINTTNGAGHIPFTALLAYTRWASIDDSETFVDVMRAVDDAFVNSANEKAQKKMEREHKKYGN